MKALAKMQLTQLKGLFSEEQISQNASDLAAHARDESAHEESPPDVIVYVQSADDVSKLLKFCNKHGIPVTPWGAGTSLEANPVAIHGGVSLDLSKMNQIIDLRPEDLQVTVQPGIVLQELNKRLSKHGLFFPPDPGAPCTIGGMVGNNAAGIQAVKYGPTKNYVIKLEVVLANGDIITCGSNAMRTSSAYNLLHLFVGSEGTLGVFTEITLKLAGIPPEVSAATASFPDLSKATSTVVELVQSGLSPAALEIMDPVTVRDINAFKGLKLPEVPTLFLEFRGNGPEVTEDVRVSQEICMSNGCKDYRVAMGREERDKLWEARHHSYYASAAANPGMRAIVVDVAVPISKFPEMVEHARRVLADKRLNGPILGHAGDGNFHVAIFYKDEPKEKSKAHEVNDSIVFRALELGGTATGEHGVGIGKIHFMETEHGKSYKLMKQIKDLLDPKGILNPGKIFH
ncbi:FAD-binding oxidoreductase [Candidatus Acetothermia bacterium]|nr:FAD-binding oxidoreductase [Candidatus Acetothermia bacterium]MBI3643204.1 FAD-binding oxidoreductase [Candidatus Acetothermia bacterium]